MTMGDRIVVMKDGFIQQVDTPEKLYNHPRNLFVAGFIGSPTMNFINGTLEESGGVVSFKAPGIDVTLPEGRAKLVRDKGYVGKEIILGVRPEDIHNEPIFLEASPDSEVNAFVEVVENLGHEIILYLSGIGEGTTIARVDSRNQVADGANIKLALDMNKIHLFDPATELNITEV